jgi:hypothetical protein
MLNEDFTTCQVEFNNPRMIQAYTYKVSRELAATLVKGDVVVVEARDWFGVARVLNVDAVPNVPEASFTLKWIVQKVNLPTK